MKDSLYTPVKEKNNGPFPSLTMQVVVTAGQAGFCCFFRIRLECGFLYPYTGMIKLLGGEGGGAGRPGRGSFKNLRFRRV